MVGKPFQKGQDARRNAGGRPKEVIGQPRVFSSARMVHGISHHRSLRKDDGEATCRGSLSGALIITVMIGFV